MSINQFAVVRVYSNYVTFNDAATIEYTGTEEYCNNMIAQEKRLDTLLGEGATYHVMSVTDAKEYISTTVNKKEYAV